MQYGEHTPPPILCEKKTPQPGWCHDRGYNWVCSRKSTQAKFALHAKKKDLWANGSQVIRDPTSQWKIHVLIPVQASPGPWKFDSCQDTHSSCIFEASAPHFQAVWARHTTCNLSKFDWYLIISCKWIFTWNSQAGCPSDSCKSSFQHLHEPGYMCRL